MYKTYRYRLYPTTKQRILLSKHFNCVRLVYNLALETKNIAYTSGVELTRFDLQKQLTELKKEFTWLKEVNAQSLQQPLSHLETAFVNFFKGRTQFPKFKTKKSKQSFQVNQYFDIDFENNKLYITKFQKEGISGVFNRKFDGKLIHCTVCKTRTNKYFVNVVVDTKQLIPSKNAITKNNSVGIDLGLKYYCVFDNGDKIDNPRFLKRKLDRIKTLQRRLRKKKKGSNNLKKEYFKIAKLYEKVTNSRNDFLHKLSTKIVSENQGAIIVEDLHINNMLKNHSLAQAISDISWGKFLIMLQYKCEWYGRTFYKIGRFDPSTKMCSGCGKTNHILTLQNREWVCPSCKVKHDRDINAAVNIKNFGLINLINTGLEQPKELMEMSTLVESMK